MKVLKVFPVMIILDGWELGVGRKALDLTIHTKTTLNVKRTFVFETSGITFHGKYKIIFV